MSLSNKEKILKKLIDAKISDQAARLSKSDKEEIDDIEIKPIGTDEIEEKILYLLCNTKNNLAKEKIEKIKLSISFVNGDLDFSGIESIPFFGDVVKQIKQESKKLSGRTLRPQQELVYEIAKEKDVVLSASTGFGKTFLFSNIALEKSEDSKSLYIVPSDLLEEQIISKLKSEYAEISEKIGNDINVNSLVITTPENVFPYIKDFYLKIKNIIVDEAHTIFYDDDERSIFAKELLRDLSENTFSKFYFISPKIQGDSNFDFLEKNIGRKFEFVTIESNKPKRIVGKYDGQFFEQVNEVKDAYEIDTHDVNSDVTLYYLNSVKDVVEFSSWLKSQKSSIDKFQLISKKSLPEEREIYKRKILSMNRYGRYLGESIARMGVCYFHGNMPTDLKNDLIELINSGWIHSIVSTHAIINGVDLPIDNLVIKSTKMHDSPMKPIDFVNLMGRVGRNNGKKRTTNFGLIILDSSKNKWGTKDIKQIEKQASENGEWWFHNKKHLAKPIDDFSSSEKSDVFAKKSIVKYNETKDKKYLIDIRVSPDVVDCLPKIYRSEDVDKLNRVIFTASQRNEKSKEIFDIEIQKLFDVYHFTEYKGVGEKTKIQSTRVVRNFFKCNMSVEQFAKQFVVYTKDKDDFNLTISLEEEIRKMKNIAKHYFMLFANHLNSLVGTIETPHIKDVLRFKLISKEAVDWLKENELSEKWIFEVSTKKSSLNKWISEIDNFDKFKKMFISEKLSKNMKMLISEISPDLRQIIKEKMVGKK